MIIALDKRLGLRALTVRQPYASEILSGDKLVEFRSWPTSYRGDLLITVSSQKAPGKPSGVSLCIVDLWDCTGEPGDFEWHLRAPRAVDLLPVKGKLKLWAPDAELVVRLALESTGRWTRP